jgi:hypothetical protein
LITNTVETASMTSGSDERRKPGSSSIPIEEKEGTEKSRNGRRMSPIRG